MALAPSTRLGVYDILAPIGAGGMGEEGSILCRDVRRRTLQRRYAAVLMAGLQTLIVAVVGCRSEAPVRPAPDQAARLASTVYTGDPNSEPQLISGFYGAEEYSWRWTAQRFSVVLRPPGGAIGEAANLVVRLSIPEVGIEKLHSISLSASIGGVTLAPETYTRSGDHSYVRAVAPHLLTSEEVRIDFQVDKVMPRVGRDDRQLGIVVTSIGLEPQ